MLFKSKGNELDIIMCIKESTIVLMEVFCNVVYGFDSFCSTVQISNKHSFLKITSLFSSYVTKTIESDKRNENFLIIQSDIEIGQTTFVIAGFRCIVCNISLI